MEKRYTNFKDFYPYYLSEHSHKTTKLLHFIGTSISLYFLFNFFRTFDFVYIILSLLSGYGFAWVSHFFIEKNKPATFKYPFYSFIGDHLMFIEIIMGKHKIL
ncbi:MAG: Mpo1-like protein [Gammaproteobacteria bacterium]|jgi:hypothetical protein|tara:strand:+ start:1587 stop:1895 length:309 start_codon:yes stop_codon:yes gene_type:complete